MVHPRLERGWSRFWVYNETTTSLSRTADVGLALLLAPLFVVPIALVLLLLLPVAVVAVPMTLLTLFLR